MSLISSWYEPASFDLPKEDLGLPKHFTREEWNRMSHYMQQYWTRGGRHVSWRLRWEHEAEQSLEDAIHDSWMRSVTVN